MGRRPRVTRKEVLEAAREAFIAGGFDGTTLAAVSARVGLSPAALLRHAATKEELFFAAMSPEESEEDFPVVAFLSSVPATEDPAKVLRRVAKELITYGEQRIRIWMVMALHDSARGEYRIRLSERQAEIRRKSFTVLADYMRRASRAGRLRLKDPEAAALVFTGSIQSYVLLQHVLKLFDPPLPVERYLDTLIQLWTRGAIRGSKGKA